MKIENEKDFENADEKLNLEKISSDEIEITDVDDIWDGPLSGSCTWRKGEYYFFTFDQLENGEDKWPRTYVLVKMTAEHKSAVEELRIAHEKRQQNIITTEEYSEDYKKFPQQIIRQSQAVGWFDDGGKDSKFMESYFSWRSKILPI